ncbi:helix-turn-helix transcriptional regulator [Allokutzneria sp. A3M-2-11 16]|uniref:helix-turn-helix domain-containing protein n=1 Tax=Allokutzneria sp. A3M-2-11 16 TaxID=2962043 RepID=UPI0020B74262|nr:helix-turn-helix transcriptional regulator [Allokutzneria sp. A3M-2-11 16]MCP3804363.1 helix-turn-helix transcriptional regulator [Allokutzneria sp. A3M-2-11 16]
MELGEFLRACRARISPADAGVPDYGGRRRVPGLRREELARLAGISVPYYTRLEQGRVRNASDSVLDAVARVLRLSADERAHLYRLARGAGPAEPERLRPSVRLMIESMKDVPALVMGRRTDVLAWNRLAHALLAPHRDFAAPQDVNLARLVFLDQHTRRLYVDYERKKRDAVAHLRMVAGAYPDDPGIAALVDELTALSEDFVALWSEYPVRNCAFNAREYDHPVVGRLTLTDELMLLPDDEGQRVVVYTAETGSNSAAALAALVHHLVS